MTTFRMLTTRTSKVNFQIWPVSARNKSMNNSKSTIRESSRFIQPAIKIQYLYFVLCTQFRNLAVSQYYSDGLTNRQAGIDSRAELLPTRPPPLSPPPPPDGDSR
jgi:hypothetical protein